MIPRRDRASLISLSLLVALIYFAAMLYFCRGHLSMPLDDTYIYFQYARQMAQGHLWRYNAMDEPSTGATSHLYLAITAIGYMLGFTDEKLILFVFGLNAIFLAISSLLIYKVASVVGGAETDGSSGGRHPSGGFWSLPQMASVLFLFNGALGWGHFSGLEMGLVSCLLLATLYSFGQRRRWMTLALASLLGICRPEGFVLTILLAVVEVVRRRRDLTPASPKGMAKTVALWSVPPLVGGVQFLLSYWLSGSISANGMKAKSWFYNVPFSLWAALKATIGYFLGFFLTPLGGWGEGLVYFAPFFFFLFLLGLIPAVLQEVRRKEPDSAVLSALWLFGGLLSTATLMTANWHYHRYQLPFFSLVIIYGVLGTAKLGNFLKRYGSTVLLPGLFTLLIVYAVGTSGVFLVRYGEACRSVYDMQIALGKWMDRNLPAKALVGVHDVGALRYFGNRSVYDLIGLTTNGAAEAWRNGSGSVFERMERLDTRPDYFAIYPHIFFVPQTDLFKEELYRIQIPHWAPVASAESEQVVYKADWHLAHSGDRMYDQEALRSVEGLALVDSVDVADLQSEKEHRYRWWGLIGYPSEARQFPYQYDPQRVVLDGGRFLTGGDEMSIHTRPGIDLLVVMRVYTLAEVELQVRVNGEDAGIWPIPNTDGQWIEAVYRIPGEQISSDLTRLRLAVRSDSQGGAHYAPFYYWFRQRAPIFSIPIVEHPLQANLGGEVRFLGYDIETVRVPSSGTLRLTLYWQAIEAMEESYTIFTHLIDAKGTIWGQKDSLPVQGRLPTTAWAKGEVVVDTYEIPIEKAAPPGRYQIEIGMYHLGSGARLPAFSESGASLPEDRILLGTIELLGG